MAQRKQQQKDVITRLAATGEDALQKLVDFPGGTRVIEAANALRDRVDELTRRMRSLDPLEKRVAELERRVAALTRAPEPMLPANAPLVPLYLGGGGEMPRLDEHLRLDARHFLLVGLERGKVSEVEWGDGAAVTRFAPPWEKQGFVVAPVEVLVAMGIAASEPFRGIELDLRIATRERGTHFVTLAHELDGPLRVTDIPADAATPHDPPAQDEAALRARYGIGRLEADGDRWSARERQSLGRALSLLSERELAKLRGISLRRMDRPKRILPAKGACGVATLEGMERWIEIYDCAFRDDDIVFAGDPRAPDRASVRILLHELGHALGTEPVHRFFLDAQRLMDDARAVDSHELADRLRTAVARVTAKHLPGPAVTAFSKLPGASGGITSYGRQSPAEAFAEAFSLYHADPEALKRVCPAALEFFERGGHLAESAR